ncbi:hypothetical protein [Naasia sp. SYSU D00057]|uniref:hypothetical protein n=1 Tax=Naasia sp. SYSU D00057 TaxID=2817380 RepID=UPI001B301FE7|nr:hypothetical protein [Naasia sp. SYSU D00057]
MTASRKSRTPVLLIVAVATLGAVAVGQAVLVARLLLDRGRRAEQHSQPSPAGAAPTALRDDIPAVPPQDPHSPPTGPVKINHRPPGGVPQAPDTDADSGFVGDAPGVTPGDSTRAGERSLS